MLRGGRTVGRWTGLVGALSMAMLIASGVTAASASAETVWLCQPGLSNNPCTSSEETTVELGNGSSFIEHPQPASSSPIDCFYVYPTVSSQFSENASLEIGSEETQIAIDQASRFSQTCNVYAPIYPQLTLPAITKPGGVTAAAAEKAYLGVLSAWQEYLAKYNDGRGVVLIGHSQGALMLEQLIKEQIDPNPALRQQLVSAILLGGNVLVPKGETVGGSFANVPSCQVAGQTGCVVAYSSFLSEPPEGADFGRVNSPLLKESLTEEEASKLEVLCVNPVPFVQGNNVGSLQRYESTAPFPGLLGPYFQAPTGPTPWVSMPEQYTGQCERANGATWLQLTDVGPEGDSRELITETLGPLWGTHLEDVNVALGNLVELAAVQARAYLGKLQVTSITPTSGSTHGETAVTIKGSGFLTGATVTIGSPATSVNVVSDTEITATTAATAAGTDEVVVTDANGTSTNGPSYSYFTVSPPTVATGVASAERANSATLNATVNPNGEEVGTCKFEYGNTASYGSSAPCTPTPGSGSSPVPVSASVTGLIPNATHHFRIVATNPGGTSIGLDQTFTTLLAPHWSQSLERLKEGEKLPYISWGRLAYTQSGGATTECQTVSAGDVENPNSRLAGSKAFEVPGIEAVEGADFYDCTNAQCEDAGGKIAVSADHLPWAGVLTEVEKATTRLESTDVGLFIRCRFASLAPTERKVTEGSLAGFEERASIEYDAPGAATCSADAPGSLTPKEVAGTSPVAPSKTVFSGGGWRRTRMWCCWQSDCDGLPQDDGLQTLGTHHCNGPVGRQELDADVRPPVVSPPLTRR
jgi:Protein of unknown function (DUF3089)/IPT/TIG domain